jgi:hypothetical protein
MTITTRTAKGSALTTAEMDTNWTDLRDGVGGLRLPKTSGLGIKVDSTGTPTFPWRDLIGDITPKASGVGSPTLATFRGGNVRSFFYSAGDDGDAVFHIPHDYVPGTDLFLHLHWAHNGTAISGSLVVNFYITYAKGHNQASDGNFAAEVTRTLTVSTPNIATVPQYRHRVDETQISAASPAASQIDSDIIETDGLILVHFDTVTIPTITGGSTNEPAYFTLDIHYQSTSIGTKQKAPDFWT